MGNTCTYIHTTHTHMHTHNVTEAPKPLPAGCIHHTYSTYRKLEGSKAWVKVGVLWLPACPCTMVMAETGISTTADPARQAPAATPRLSSSTCSSFLCQIRWISIHFRVMAFLVSECLNLHYKSPTDEGGTCALVEKTLKYCLQNSFQCSFCSLQFLVEKSGETGS